MRDFALTTPELVRKAKRLPDTCRDHFLMYDAPEDMAAHAKSLGKARSNASDSARSFTGNCGLAEAITKTARGDESLVAPSDKLLAEFEGYDFDTHGKVTIASVYGTRPNVSAFLQGNPKSMKRRLRQDKANAPIAIVFDVTCSAGIPAKDIARRGAAILALVRLLSERRPVELWAASQMGTDKGENITTLCRIDTAPLNLGVAAFIATHAAYLRQTCFHVSDDKGFNGHWPYNGGSLSVEHMQATIAPALSHIGETLCIPGMHFCDEAANEPERWIKNHLDNLMPKDLGAVA